NESQPTTNHQPPTTVLHQPRDIQSAERAAQAIARGFINFAPAFVNRGHDQVLQHFDVARGFRLNFDGKDFFETVHFDLHNAAPPRRVNAQGFHLFHHLFLHLLSLFHHLLYIHSTRKFHITLLKFCYRSSRISDVHHNTPIPKRRTRSSVAQPPSVTRQSK